MIRSRLNIILAAGFLSVLVGCGSGGDTAGIADPITEQSRATYSADALLLASKETDEVWISSAVAGEIDEHLARVRTKYPEVADLHPAGYGSERSLLEILLISVDSDASWIADWKAGKLHTGEADLDEVLEEFNAKKIAPMGLEADNRTWFRIDFAQPLNLTNLAKRVKAASTRLKSVEPNGIVGDGNDIVRGVENTLPVYTFSLGWGDCPAGCINKHYWEFTLKTASEITLTERGDDLDAEAIASGRMGDIHSLANPTPATKPGLFEKPNGAVKPATPEKSVTPDKSVATEKPLK